MISGGYAYVLLIDFLLPIPTIPDLLLSLFRIFELPVIIFGFSKG